ncbi:hypothetical protein ACIRU3_04730 [Streptomyces sp. NPDC101151]|uniref:hypothetical protein n=1 Tax=Streptomyces sp. NPDC101151 TaxID=3366115 RepID=UPI003810E989
MKSLKAAAVIVGTLAIAGAAGPALAADMPAQGLLEDGKTIAHTLPNASELPAGYLSNDVKNTAEGVKQSGVVKTPVFGGMLPNPLNGKPVAALPIAKKKK